MVALAGSATTNPPMLGIIQRNTEQGSRIVRISQLDSHRRRLPQQIGLGAILLATGGWPDERNRGAGRTTGAARPGKLPKSSW